jgi:peptidoglycan/xylan/chitin deacetylase (PgdA/CDA1 family)
MTLLVEKIEEITVEEASRRGLGQAVEPRICPPATLRVPKGKARRVGIKEWLGVQLAATFNDLCGPREKSAFGVLMYHRVVDEPPRVSRPTWNVPPEQFENQLSGLLARGWVAWPLSQVLACRDRGLPIPRKTFVVTFDDGYANTFTQALSILTRLGVPATVFVATAYLDSEQPFPSDDWDAAGQPGVPREAWRPLSSDECLRLAASGLVELGAHTHTHADFRGRPAALVADLRENLAVLREQFGVDQPAFAFPYGTKADGFVSNELASAAREAGVKCCLTTEGRIVRPADSEFDWGRFAAEKHDSARTLAARLGGWQEAVRGFRVRGSGFRKGQV